MKLQIVSDTHNDLRKFKPNKNADLIVHAGDFNSGRIASIQPIVDFVDLCKAYNKECVFVLGNHDYYGNNFYNSYIERECFKRKYNLLTRNKIFEFKGYTFVGGIFGTDFKLPGDFYKDVDLTKFYSQRNINDFYEIYTDDSFCRLLLPEDYIVEYNKSVELIESYRYEENIVIVSHFPLSSTCVDPRYNKNVLNPYFINDINLEGIRTIISGHTHTTMHNKVGDTDIYINAYGYSDKFNFECALFDPDFIIEV